MAQLAQVVLTDRQSTPASHTFTPRDIRDGVGTLIESSGVPVGNSRLSISTRLLPSGRYRSELKLAVPILVNETINGVTVPKVARTSYIDAVFTFEATSSTQERANAVGMFASALASSQTMLNASLVGLESVY